MAPLVLLDSRIFAGGSDLTGVSNKIELGSEMEDKDTTAFGQGGWKSVIGGLFSTSITGSGQWEATADPSSVDPSSWDALVNRRNQPWTICPVDASHGSLAYFTSALRSEIKLGEAVGEVAPWEGSAIGTSPLLRGAVVHPPGTARTADGAGTGLELGALADGQRLYASLHLLSVSGTSSPSITARVESAPDNTFADATTRLTFDPAGLTPAGARGQVAVAVGPVTDEWWRVAWDVTAGTTPSFLFLSALGIA